VADEIASAGVVSERRALAWTLRVVEGVSREDAAAMMGVSTSTLDKQLSAARSEIEAARETVDVVDELIEEGSR
jgi:DNA-directed RNA polymerase specialized sigma24 family protein